MFFEHFRMKTREKEAEHRITIALKMTHPLPHISFSTVAILYVPSKNVNEMEHQRKRCQSNGHFMKGCPQFNISRVHRCIDTWNKEIAGQHAAHGEGINDYAPLLLLYERPKQ